LERFGNEFVSPVSFMLPEKIAAITAHDIEKAIACTGTDNSGWESAEGEKYPGMNRLKKWRPAYFERER
jgi:hypothetical protein